MLVKRALREKLLFGVEIVRSKVAVSHLQYADDTLLVLDGNENNARATMWLLKNFQVLSGLSVNFERSCVFGINLGEGEVESVAGN